MSSGFLSNIFGKYYSFSCKKKNLRKKKELNYQLRNTLTVNFHWNFLFCCPITFSYVMRMYEILCPTYWFQTIVSMVLFTFIGNTIMCIAARIHSFAYIYNTYTFKQEIHTIQSLLISSTAFDGTKYTSIEILPTKRSDVFFFLNKFHRDWRKNKISKEVTVRQQLEQINKNGERRKKANVHHCIDYTEEA